jgi:tubulin polyglutamylase TTLL6/13
MHLTNYAINKLNENFEFNEDDEVDDTGHKRSMTSILKHLESKGEDVGKVMK